jgi:hypothetical protein
MLKIFYLQFVNEWKWYSIYLGGPSWAVCTPAEFSESALKYFDSPLGGFYAPHWSHALLYFFVTHNPFGDSVVVSTFQDNYEKYKKNH